MCATVHPWGRWSNACPMDMGTANYSVECCDLFTCRDAHIADGGRGMHVQGIMHGSIQYYSAIRWSSNEILTAMLCHMP